MLNNVEQKKHYHTNGNAVFDNLCGWLILQYCASTVEL